MVCQFGQWMKTKTNEMKMELEYKILLPLTKSKTKWNLMFRVWISPLPQPTVFFALQKHGKTHK